MMASGTAEVVMAINLISPVILGVIGYLLRRAIADMDRRMNSVESRMAEAERVRAASEAAHVVEHQRLERDVVGKEDWLRESGMARQRQEKIFEELRELAGKQEMGVEIAAAIAAALNRREVAHNG